MAKSPVFRVSGASLSLVDKQPSSGAEPNAIAQYGDLVYVLNVGGSSNVVGFRLNGEGKLKRITDSVRFLTTNNSEGASLAFSTNGRFLLVSERATNNIDAFLVQHDGTLSPIVVNDGVGAWGVFLGVCSNGAALVSETGPAAGATMRPLYRPTRYTTMEPFPPSAPEFQLWVMLTAGMRLAPDGRFVYVSNAGSSTISGFVIGRSGSLTPIGSTVVGFNPAGSTNLDIAVSSDGKFLYTLNSGTGAIGIFGIQKDGTLTNRGTVEGLPENAGINGIAAF